jgi:NADPH2:quinone reductase
MKAAVASEQGLVIRDVPQPRPKPNEILVRVRAVGLNRADINQSTGGMHGAHGGLGAIVGLECAGEVAEVGAEVKEFKPGDRVTCSGNGTYCEYAVTDWGRALPVPTGMNFETAVTLPLALQTMHDAVATNGALQIGDNILIQGASSGVGLMGLQIARYKGAKLVIGSSTDAERRGRLKEFGADQAIDSKDPNWPDAVVKATNGGVNVIVDQISGGSTMNQNMKAAAVQARIVNVGRLGGLTGELDFNLHAMKRIRYIGVTFRTRSVEEVRTLNRKMRQDIWGLVEDRKLRLPVDRVFSLDDAAAALAHMKANKHFGKIVLTV